MIKTVGKVIVLSAICIARLGALDTISEEKLRIAEEHLEDVTKKLLAKQDQIFALEERIHRLRKTTLDVLENDLKKTEKDTAVIEQKLAAAAQMLDDGAIDLVKIFTTELLVAERHSLASFLDKDFTCINYPEIFMLNQLFHYYEQVAFHELIKKWEAAVADVARCKKMSDLGDIV